MRTGALITNGGRYLSFGATGQKRVVGGELDLSATFEELERRPVELHDASEGIAIDTDIKLVAGTLLAVDDVGLMIAKKRYGDAGITGVSETEPSDGVREMLGCFGRLLPARIADHLGNLGNQNFGRPAFGHVHDVRAVDFRFRDAAQKLEDAAPARQVVVTRNAFFIGHCRGDKILFAFRNHLRLDEVDQVVDSHVQQTLDLQQAVACGRDVDFLDDGEISANHRDNPLALVGDIGDITIEMSHEDKSLAVDGDAGKRFEVQHFRGKVSEGNRVTDHTFSFVQRTGCAAWIGLQSPLVNCN